MEIVARKKNQDDDEPRKESRDGFLSEIKFRESLKDLEEAAENLRGNRSEDECALDPACCAAELRVQLFRAEHDNAGAFKFKRYTRETVGLFDAEKINISQETGKYALSPELANRRYLLVSMGELDRLNKEGHSQETGDAGLRGVIKLCDEMCVKYLGRERALKTNIFRYGGNEYCIEFENITPDELKAIENAILCARLDLGDAYKNIEPPPLTTHRIHLADTIDILNDSSEQLDANDAAHKTISIFRRQADFNLEVKKFISRVNRAIHKLKTSKTRDEANDFFDNYLKKGFYLSELQSLDDVEAFIKDKNPDALQHAIEWMAEDEAKERFAEERELDVYENHLVDARHNELIQNPEKGPDMEDVEHNFDTNPRIAVIPQITRGLAALSGANMEMISAKGTPWAEVKRLQYEIEAARRDEGTGLLERGQFYEDWIGQVDSAEATEINAAVVFIDMGFLKYFNDAGGRKVGDAALRKAAELMEEALNVSGVKGEVYRYGGDEFAIRVEGGRDEAKKVTVALEDLRSHAGRIPDLKGLHEQKGTLGKLGKAESSRADYAPTELVFNSGTAEIQDFFIILNDLRESGELPKILKARGMSETEFKASLMVKLADTSVNYEKALSRFYLLIELMNKPEYRDTESSYHNRVESIIKYSQKAILSPLGGDAALRIFADSFEHEDRSVLEAQIERFVADRVEKTREIAQGNKTLIDKLVEIHAAKSRLEEQVELLKAELGGKNNVLAHEHARVKELEVMLVDAEKARRALVEARQTITPGILDKKAQIG